MKETKKLIIYTIGHSTRTFSEFIKILKAYDIKRVVDIRTVPRSRFNPQFNSASFAKRLKAHKFFYKHMKGLGGLRHALKDSINTAWHNLSFRGFADYMQTEPFEKALEKLIDMAHKKVTVIMCAEAVPWRCHRSLIGDALLARGVKVVDIMSATSSRAHTLTPWAKKRKTKIIYPG